MSSIFERCSVSIEDFDEPEVVDDSSEDFDAEEELAEAVGYATQADADCDDITEKAETLEEVTAAAERFHAQGSLSAEAMQLLGITYGSTALSLGCESFSSDNVEAALEGLKEAAVKIWEWVKQAFNQAITFIKRVWQGIMGYDTRIKNKLKALIEEIEATPEDKFSEGAPVATPKNRFFYDADDGYFNGVGGVIKGISSFTTDSNRLTGELKGITEKIRQGLEAGELKASPFDNLSTGMKPNKRITKPGYLTRTLTSFGNKELNVFSNIFKPTLIQLNTKPSVKHRPPQGLTAGSRKVILQDAKDLLRIMQSYTAGSAFESKGIIDSLSKITSMRSFKAGNMTREKIRRIRGSASAARALATNLSAMSTEYIGACAAAANFLRADFKAATSKSKKD